MPLRRAVFIANPLARHVSKRGDLEAAIHEAAARFALDPHLHWTDAPDAATALAREAEQEGAEIIFACGGDGILNEVLNGLQDARTIVGQVPAGTVNVWAREAGIPRGHAAALNTQLAAAPLAIDLARAGERRFLLMASFGFDAHAVASVNPALKRRFGPSAYIVAGIRAGWRYPGFRLGIAFDDDPPQRIDASMLVLGNTRSYGGMSRVTPRASAVDGLLDCVAFLGYGLIPMLRLLPLTLRGRHLESPRVLFRRARCVRLVPVPGETLPDLQVDGEIATPAAEIRVEPAAVRMLVPRPERPLFRPG